MVCELHFRPNEIIKNDKYLQHDGSSSELLLGALVWSKFLYRLHFLIFHHTYLKLFSSRELAHKKDELIMKRHENEITSFLNSDMIHDFNDLTSNICKNADLTGWEFKVVTNKLYILTLNHENYLSVVTSVIINLELKV